MDNTFFGNTKLKHMLKCMLFQPMLSEAKGGGCYTLVDTVDTYSMTAYRHAANTL